MRRRVLTKDGAWKYHASLFMPLALALLCDVIGVFLLTTTTPGWGWVFIALSIPLSLMGTQR